jgi:hypothetical protein
MVAHVGSSSATWVGYVVEVLGRYISILMIYPVGYGYSSDLKTHIPGMSAYIGNFKIQVKVYM